MKTSLTTVFVFLLIQCIETAPSSCVSKDMESYICTNDALHVRRMLGPNKAFMGTSNLVSGGVIQRVDGSEAEKKAVKTVMQKMHDYFINEVYSKAVYEPFLPRCQNKNELCAFWTSVNECETNRIFMLNYCAAACRFCLLASTNLV